MPSLQEATIHRLIGRGTGRAAVLDQITFTPGTRVVLHPHSAAAQRTNSTWATVVSIHGPTDGSVVTSVVVAVDGYRNHVKIAGQDIIGVAL